MYINKIINIHLLTITTFGLCQPSISRCCIQSLYIYRLHNISSIYIYLFQVFNARTALGNVQKIEMHNERVSSRIKVEQMMRQTIHLEPYSLQGRFSIFLIFFFPLSHHSLYILLASNSMFYKDTCRISFELKKKKKDLRCCAH